MERTTSILKFSKIILSLSLLCLSALLIICIVQNVSVNIFIIGLALIFGVITYILWHSYQKNKKNIMIYFLPMLIHLTFTILSNYIFKNSTQFYDILISLFLILFISTLLIIIHIKRSNQMNDWIKYRCFWEHYRRLYLWRFRHTHKPVRRDRE